LQKLAEQFGIAPEQIIPYSAKARVGYDSLWKAIKAAAGAEEAQGEDVPQAG